MTENLHENGLIFPLLEDAKSDEVDIFQKMKEKETTRTVPLTSVKVNPPETSQSKEEPVTEYIKVNKRKKPQKRARNLRDHLE